MSAWPTWPFLMRPVWYLFSKMSDDRIAAVAFLGNPLVLWPALPALAVCLRDWIVTRRAIAFAGFAAMLPISVAFVGTTLETFTRLMLFRSWI
jgi:dolichyl-phosphate-mannose--protein O-mannosyl transferase